ncbi:MAG: hypothetical protein AABN33_11980 [Acidobacteriota bacterium]
MRTLSKIQFSRAIEGESEVTAEGNAPLSAPHRSRRTTKLIVTALVVALGIGAGWLGGKVLSGGSHPPPAPPANDVSASDDPAPRSRPLPESQPPAKGASEKPAAPSSESAPEAEKPVVVTEPPPKLPRVDKEEERAEKPEIPTEEDSAKEVGRQALKKMKKEPNNMNGGKPPGNKNENPGNKNANEDRH